MSVVVFDIDDTLYLERDYVRSGFAAVDAHVTSAHGTEGFLREAWTLFMEGVRGTTFNRALAQIGLTATPDLLQALVHCYRTHVPLIALLPDARDCLSELHARCQLAAITDGPLESQRNKVAALGLSTWLRPIVLTAEWGEGFGKPHPRAFELIETTFGQSGRACTYVADNPLKDFHAPASRGWRTVRVRRPGGLHQLLPSGADVELEVELLSSLSSALEI